MMSDSQIKVFHFNKLKIELHPEVYEPSEDTFQLIEALKIKKDESILEIGTGCGIIALECSRRGSNVICTDINPYAIKFTKRNINHNHQMLKGNIEVKQGNLFSIIKKDEQFDVVIFNPPYLPTQPEDKVKGSGWFDLATNGGIDGLSVITIFIKELHNHLKKNGRAYFVFSSLADRKKLEKTLKNSGLKFKVIISRRFDDELIEIYCVNF